MFRPPLLLLSVACATLQCVGHSAATAVAACSSCRPHPDDAAAVTVPSGQQAFVKRPADHSHRGAVALQRHHNTRLVSIPGIQPRGAGAINPLVLGSSTLWGCDSPCTCAHLLMHALMHARMREGRAHGQARRDTTALLQPPSTITHNLHPHLSCDPLALAPESPTHASETLQMSPMPRALVSLLS